MSSQRKSILSYIPGYTHNAVLQLIVFSLVLFAVLGLLWGGSMLLENGDISTFNRMFFSNVALPSVALFKSHWWTVLTYGWFHFGSFWEFFSNMLWLYCFGSVVQMLVGYRQVIPLYAYSLLAGGAFYLLSQLLPGELGRIPNVAGIVGARAGLMGMAAAAVTLAPDYRFYLTETFRIHILVVAGIFAALVLLSTAFNIPLMLLVAGGGLTGFVYVKLLKAGYRPGGWVYDMGAKMESLVTPDENAIRRKNGGRRSSVLSKIQGSKSVISQKRIDDILDKINLKGYNSLSAEEKEILMRVGKDQ